MRYFSQLKNGARFILVSDSDKTKQKATLMVKVCKDYWIVNMNPNCLGLKREVKVNSISVEYPAVTYYIEPATPVVLID